MPASINCRCPYCQQAMVRVLRTIDSRVKNKPRGRKKPPPWTITRRMICNICAGVFDLVTDGETDNASEGVIQRLRRDEKVVTDWVPVGDAEPVLENFKGGMVGVGYDIAPADPIIQGNMPGGPEAPEAPKEVDESSQAELVTTEGEEDAA